MSWWHWTFHWPLFPQIIFRLFLAIFHFIFHLKYYFLATVFFPRKPTIELRTIILISLFDALLSPMFTFFTKTVLLDCKTIWYKLLQLELLLNLLTRTDPMNVTTYSGLETSRSEVIHSQAKEKVLLNENFLLLISWYHWIPQLE